MIGTAHLEIHASLVGMEGRMLYRKIELYLKHFRVRNKQIQILLRGGNGMMTLSVVRRRLLSRGSKRRGAAC